MNVNALVLILLAIVCVFISNPVFAKTTRLSDDQVKQQIINDSVAAYPGTCACPFNRARNGSSCGRRSAWSRAGGYAPLCYKDEVTQNMVKQWREQNQ